MCFTSDLLLKYGNVPRKVKLEMDMSVWIDDKNGHRIQFGKKFNRKECDYRPWIDFFSMLLVICLYQDQK